MTEHFCMYDMADSAVISFITTLTSLVLGFTPELTTANANLGDRPALSSSRSNKSGRSNGPRLLALTDLGPSSIKHNENVLRANKSLFL
jgi:hypothetical protein